MPQPVSEAFVEALTAQKRRLWRAAGMTFRASLEIALKEFAPDLEGMLKSRLDQLAKSARIPPDLATFGHGVRLLGNDAAHEVAAPTEKDVLDIATLTELVLTYVFTLPGVLEERKKEAEAKEASR